MKRIWAPWRGEFIKGKKNIGILNECVFCTLSNSQISPKTLVLYKSKKSYVLMNKYPYNNGHIMIIPNTHVSSFEDLSNEEYIDLSLLLKDSIKIINEIINPHASNIGMNLGIEAGAGIKDHLHYHIVPRWNGDTNFMPLFSETKIISEHLDYTYNKLIGGFEKL